MAKEKSSIYISEEIKQKLTRRGNDSFSQGVEKISRRYFDICSRSIPAMTKSEIMAIVDVCNGLMWDYQRIDFLPQMLSAEVGDGCELEGLDKKWGINKNELSGKIGKLQPIEVMAILDAVEEFWTQNTYSDNEPDVNKIFKIKN